MNKSIRELQGYTIHAIDGDLGKVVDLYFDDDAWTIRYMIVQNGTWLSARRVLVSPKSVREVDWQNRRVLMALTQDRVRKSPDIDTAIPVSRQYELEFNQYYGYEHYWLNTGVWEYNRRSGTQNPHLRSAKEVIGYHIRSKDGKIGHAEDFLFDDASWQIQFMLVDTSNWGFGKKVIVSQSIIENIIWTKKQIVVNLTSQIIRTSPEFNPASHVK